LHLGAILDLAVVLEEARFKGRLAEAADDRAGGEISGFSSATTACAPGVAAGANLAMVRAKGLTPAATPAVVVRGSALSDAGGWLNDVAAQ
jgi:hypothetical protein